MSKIVRDMGFKIEEELTSATRSFGQIPTDDVMSDPLLEVYAQGVWVVTERDIWDAWTGLRKRNGEDYHGDVHPISSPTNIWTGPRVCSCRTCQSHTDPKFRPN